MNSQLAIEKSSASTLSRLSAAQKLFDLERIREESFGECDNITNELRENRRKATEDLSSEIKSLKVANVEHIKSLMLFKDGGTYSVAEREMYRTRARKLDVKLIRFEFMQSKDLELSLPEKIELVEEAKRKWIAVYDDHYRDVSMLVNLAKIKRESNVFVTCELSRMEKDVKDMKSELVALENWSDNFWNQTEISAAELHQRIQGVRNKLGEVMNSLKNPDSKNLQSTLKSSQTLAEGSEPFCLPKDFYTKWLLDPDAMRNEETPAKSQLCRRMSSLRMNRRISVAIPRDRTSTDERSTSPNLRRISTMDSPRSPTFKRPSVMQRPSAMQRPPQIGALPQTKIDENRKPEKSEEIGTKVTSIRRKILDPKSEVKQSIFGFHIKPKQIDFPTIVTALIFDRVSKLLDAHEEYYKTRGAHSITRPEQILDTFEKSCEKVRQETIEYETKAVHKTNAAFRVVLEILQRSEKIHVTLPKILFRDFHQVTTKSILERIGEIQARHQILMDNFEEAKEEHFESIRINIGHPSYEGQLTELKNKEATRRVSFFAILESKTNTLEKTHTGH